MQINVGSIERDCPESPRRKRVEDGCREERARWRQRESTRRIETGSPWMSGKEGKTEREKRSESVEKDDE